MISDLSGLVAVVTGGASGIGEAVARLAVARGATVVIADLDPARAAAVADELGGHAVTLDVGSAPDVEAAAERIEREVGAVDVLVTSAGITQRPLPPEHYDVADWDEVLRVDLRGTWLCAVEFGRRMAVRGQGSIVTIASVAGMRSMPLHAYTPAKAGVIAMTADLATEWGRSGVRVNSVAPGYTLTPLLRERIDSGERDPSNLAGESALGRMVDAEEVARAVCFLASDEASAVTGVNLPVDAGWLVAPTWRTYNGIPDKR
ncbi:SDR family NAD(P)-dependent oxidoreductase [Pseudonocardia sp. N23]|uniref:SDR family NAD(P)-dependent oxidoreductase n=1 Tax=Pseudonocardia sp. N23 TaxID=1987376 RepID=UPI000BFE304F|nr:SDR family oxidoreductase [Pseudonocardia sp. N23]GAY11185.1 3-oxoacyl-[acyl-carrier protein] reductase [Pseudonocardia sp. N23]